jgi:hypothetical protein
MHQKGASVGAIGIRQVAEKQVPALICQESKIQSSGADSVDSGDPLDHWIIDFENSIAIKVFP